MQLNWLLDFSAWQQMFAHHNFSVFSTSPGIIYKYNDPNLRRWNPSAWVFLVQFRFLPSAVRRIWHSATCISFSLNRQMVRCVGHGQGKAQVSLCLQTDCFLACSTLTPFSDYKSLDSESPMQATCSNYRQNSCSIWNAVECFWSLCIRK